MALLRLMSEPPPERTPYERLALRILYIFVCLAEDGDLADRVWLMSNEGGAFMEGVGIDPGRLRARLVDTWVQDSLRMMVKSR
jgi:hypothetical protein